MEEDGQIARVVWRDITFYKNRGAKEDENWDQLLLRFETIGRIKEKDGVLRVQSETPIITDTERFYTEHEPMVQLIPLGCVETVDIYRFSSRIKENSDIKIPKKGQKG